MSRELQAELDRVIAALVVCRSRLDGLGLHAAAADANQAIGRVRDLIRSAAALADE